MLKKKLKKRLEELEKLENILRTINKLKSHDTK